LSLPIFSGLGSGLFVDYHVPLCRIWENLLSGLSRKYLKLRRNGVMKESSLYSKLRDKKRTLLDKLPLDFPYSIYLEPTNRCTFRCKACPISFDDYESTAGYVGDMDLKLYEKIILNIKDLGKLKSLKFYMLGEPLMNKDIIKMMRFAREQDVAQRFELTTNASLLTEDIMNGLIDVEFDSLRVSVYSVYQDRFERVTCSKMSVGKIFENVKAARKTRDASGKEYPHIYVKMIDTFDEEENKKFRYI
jgi:sulfatase maturation enzyme AslB (radical SAM superfamily)